MSLPVLGIKFTATLRIVSVEFAVRMIIITIIVFTIVLTIRLLLKITFIVFGFLVVHKFLNHTRLKI